jgi:hypothetical protein
MSTMMKAVRDGLISVALYGISRLLDVMELSGPGVRTSFALVQSVGIGFQQQPNDMLSGALQRVRSN